MALLIAFEAISSEKSDEFDVGFGGEVGAAVVGTEGLGVAVTSKDVLGSVKFIKEYTWRCVSGNEPTLTRNKPQSTNRREKRKRLLTINTQTHNRVQYSSKNGTREETQNRPYFRHSLGRGIRLTNKQTTDTSTSTSLPPSEEPQQNRRRRNSPEP